MEVMEEEVTATPFGATVRDGEPYCFDAFSAQDVRTSVRITHIAYHPPTSMEDVESFYAAHPEAPRPVKSSSSSAGLTFAVAEVEDLSIGNEPRRVVVGCFPLDLQRVQQAASSSSSSSSSSGVMKFQYEQRALLPLDTDVIRGVNIRLDGDGCVKLYMKGPGEIYFYGEQFSALIPEWENHRFFKVGEDDEEEEEFSDMSEGELNEMFRRAR